MAGKILRLLHPNRYIVIIFLFFVIFPVFMDWITPEVMYGYAGGTVNAQGEVITRYEGGTAPQYQWYYPILYPFMVIWYVAVLVFDIFDVVIPDEYVIYYSAQAMYFYLLAAVFGTGIRLIVVAVRNGVSRSRTQP